MSSPIRWEKAAPRGGGGENEHADREDLAAASKIAQRSAGQEQRRQRERVGFDDPLNFGQRRVETRTAAPAERRSRRCRR